MYQRKYYHEHQRRCYGRGFSEREGEHTWLVHTLLKVTKAKVCASMVLGRSFLASRRGRAMAERNSCGMKARDSRFMVFVDDEGREDERYKRVL